MMNDEYVKSLEEQCAAWEKMYNEDVAALARERDSWKERALNAEMHKESLAEKLEHNRLQLRHV